MGAHHAGARTAGPVADASDVMRIGETDDADAVFLARSMPISIVSLATTRP